MAVPPMSAAPANIYMEPTAPNVREDLADIIYRIDPDETPFVSMIASVGADQVLTEYLVQELNPADDNAQPEGFTASISAAKKPVRLNNICQILARTVGVSNTLRAVNTVGGEDEYNRQAILRGLEVRRDLELAFTSPFVKTITDPRHMSGLPCYCVNGSRGATGSMPIGDGTNAGTAGTARDLDLNTINTAIQQVWTAGGRPTVALMSGNIKSYFSNIAMGGANNPIAAQNIQMTTERVAVTINGAVDVYRSNFGELQLTPDRFMPAHMLEIITPDYVESAPLPGREFVQEDYAKTGDNTQGGVVYEGTLRVTAPKAHAVIWDLNQ